MSAAAAARGPLKFLLASPLGQYVVLGAGLVSVFPEEFRKVASPFLQDLVGLGFAVPSRFVEGGKESRQNQQQQPIIIHTPAPYMQTISTRRSVAGFVTYVVVGAGACWGIYVIGTQLLPEQIAQMMPVTKKLFEKTSQTLGQGLLTVKQVLEEKILGLARQQEELSDQQRATHTTTQDIKQEVCEARIDLNLLKGTLRRCEDSLEDSQNMQGYTLRGVKLLVRCIAGFISNDPSQQEELSRFIEDGDHIQGSSSDSRPALGTTPARQTLPSSQMFLSAPRSSSIPRVSSLSDQSESDEDPVFKSVQALLTPMKSM